MTITHVDGHCLRVLEWLNDTEPHREEVWLAVAARHELVAVLTTFSPWSLDRPQWDVIVCKDGSSLWRQWGTLMWMPVGSYAARVPARWAEDRARALRAWYLLHPDPRDDDELPF
jgi:hypothetical protein